MKRLACVALVAMAMALVVPLPSDAGQTNVFVGGRYSGGHSGYGGHSGWRGYHAGGGHHQHSSGSRFYFGTTFLYGPPWYSYPGYPAYPYYPYYYAAPPVVIETPPPVYVQPDTRAEQEAYYWYYCQDPQGYYPYIKSCPGGWMKVVPDTTPPGQ